MNSTGNALEHRVRRLAAPLALAIAAPAAVAQIHYDPPGNPPVQTVWTWDRTIFYTDVDDGTNGLSELLIQVTVHWGTGHTDSAFIVWQGDLDLDGAGPWTAPNGLQRVHVECSPAEMPTIVVKGWEMDEGVDAVLQLVLTTGGGVIGGLIGLPSGPGSVIGAGIGAAAGYAIGEGLDALNGNDVLVHGTDFLVRRTPGQVTLPPAPGCAQPPLPVSHGVQMVPPPAGIVPPPPGSYEVIVDPDDNYFLSVVRPLCEARAAATSGDLREAYLAVATTGIDEHHPFSRSVTHARAGFAGLVRTVELADQSRLETGPGITLGAEQHTINMRRVKGTAVGCAYIVANQTLIEAVQRGFTGGLVAAAAQKMHVARWLSDNGQYTAAIDEYRDATLPLIAALHPSFNRIVADRATLSVLRGGRQTLTLDAGRQFAGQRYAILGTASGIYPGTMLLGAHVPINVDSYTVLTLGGSGLISGPVGFLDDFGRATVHFDFPPGLPLEIAGLVHLSHTFVATIPNAQGLLTANAVPLEFVR